MWCDAYAPHLESAKSRLNPESHWLVNGSFLLTESFCKNYLFSATSLWCTLVNPFLVVHPTHILVQPRVHRAHRLNSAALMCNRVSGFGLDIGVHNFYFSDMIWIWSSWKSFGLEQDCKVSISYTSDWYSWKLVGRPWRYQHEIWLGDLTKFHE